MLVIKETQQKKKKKVKPEREKKGDVLLIFKERLT
jgi:hypothetical protein